MENSNFYRTPLANKKSGSANTRFCLSEELRSPKNGENASFIKKVIDDGHFKSTAERISKISSKTLGVTKIEKPGIFLFPPRFICLTSF